jgi:hypothetical protein
MANPAIAYVLHTVLYHLYLYLHLVAGRFWGVVCVASSLFGFAAFPFNQKSDVLKPGIKTQTQWTYRLGRGRFPSASPAGFGGSNGLPAAFFSLAV